MLTLILKKYYSILACFLNKYSPHFIKKYRACFLSGILIGVSFIPFPVFAVFFCWVPLWLFLSQQTKIKHVLIGSWIAQWFMTAIGFSWVAYTAHNFGGLNWPVSLLALALFCGFANSFIVIASVTWFLLTRKLKKNKDIVLKLLLLPILFSLFHLITPTVFAWNMGYNWLWAGFSGFHTAEVWGFKFLNTLLYVFNLLFLILYKHRLDKIGKSALLSAVILFASLNGFGWYLKKRLVTPQKSLNALVVQNNIGSIDNLKYRPHFRSPLQKSLYQSKNITIRALLRLRKKRKNIDFIVWPESAYPYVLLEKRLKITKLSSLIRKMKIPLITGVGIKRQHGYSNSLIVINKRGKLMRPPYYKTKLLAFGEVLPGSKAFPFIKKLVPSFGNNLVPGDGPMVKNLGGINLGLQICYESLFDSFTRNLALQGAQVIINITNDSWYGSWQQPWQHLFISLARAIEVRRPMIRATNTGISTVINSDGYIQSRSPLNKPWAQVYNVPYYDIAPQTLFMSWGYYINEIFLLLLFLFGFAVNRYANKR